jgi:hypothetical protein
MDHSSNNKRNSIEINQNKSRKSFLDSSLYYLGALIIAIISFGAFYYSYLIALFFNNDEDKLIDQTD